jgi:hypothetical protein
MSRGALPRTENPSRTHATYAHLTYRMAGVLMVVERVRLTLTAYTTPILYAPRLGGLGTALLARL